jgi:hypothetical protein
MATVTTRRILILGASNVTLAFPLLASACLRPRNVSTELFAAHGHGRSLCARSFVLNRGLPSIRRCGIWNVLKSRPPVDESWAFVTDVGNDLIYGFEVEEILQRLNELFEQVAGLGMPLTFVRLPVERALQLTEWRYRVIKQMLFPGKTIPWSTLSRRMIDLDARAAQTAAAHQAVVLTPRLSWYGIDPIHIRRSRRIAAWQEITGTANLSAPLEVRSVPLRQALICWRLPPWRRSYGRQVSVQTQPVRQDLNGNSIWLF